MFDFSVYRTYFLFSQIRPDVFWCVFQGSPADQSRPEAQLVFGMRADGPRKCRDIGHSEKYRQVQQQWSRRVPLVGQDMLTFHEHLYIDTCTDIHTCTHIQIYIHAHTHAHTHTSMHTCMHIYAYTHIYMHTHIHAHTDIHAHTCMPTHTYIHACTHTYIHTVAHKHTHAHTYTYTHTHIHAHIHICTHMHIHVYTQVHSVHTHTHKYTYTNADIHACTHTHTQTKSSNGVIIIKPIFLLFVQVETESEVHPLEPRGLEDGSVFSGACRTAILAAHAR